MVLNVDSGRIARQLQVRVGMWLNMRTRIVIWRGGAEARCRYWAALARWPVISGAEMAVVESGNVTEIFVPLELD